MQSCFRVSCADRVVIGEMLEWLKRHAWKACIPLKGIRSSNLLLSANVMKLGASRRAFSFECRQELAPVKAFKCKSPTAFGRELHDACKGPSGKEQRKGTRSVANLITFSFPEPHVINVKKSDVPRVLFRENVLSGTRCTILYVLFRENVLDGTK